MKISDKTYNYLKWCVMIVLPAVTTLYGNLAPVWGFENADKVLTTMTGITTFLGAVIGISTVTYNKEQK